MPSVSEPAVGRALTHQITAIPYDEMTVDLCTAACRAASFILAGVEYAGECCTCTHPNPASRLQAEPINDTLSLREYPKRWRSRN